MKNLLGGKGANLAEMASIGLPVPPGFTLTTEVCTHFYQNDCHYPKDWVKKKEWTFEMILNHQLFLLLWLFLWKKMHSPIAWKGVDAPSGESLEIGREPHRPRLWWFHQSTAGVRALGSTCVHARRGGFSGDPCCSQTAGYNWTVLKRNLLLVQPNSAGDIFLTHLFLTRWIFLVAHLIDFSHQLSWFHRRNDGHSSEPRP